MASVCSLAELPVAARVQQAFRRCPRSMRAAMQIRTTFLSRPRGSARLQGDDRDLTRLILEICLLCRQERLVAWTQMNMGPGAEDHLRC